MEIINELVGHNNNS